MRGIAITSRGLEDTAAVEINELTGAKCKSMEGCVVFDFKSISDLCVLCYKCQSADRILYLIGDFEFKDFFDGMKRFIGGLKLDKWIDESKKFKVECRREGSHDFNSVDVEARTAEFILSASKNKKADIKDYDIIFFVYIMNNKCYLGVDFAGFELNKRGYKIFMCPNSLRGTIAYALIRESGFKKGGSMLDPFSRDGVIAIETGFYAADFPHNYYKKDRFAFLKLKLGINFDKLFSSLDKKIKKPKAGIYCYDHLFKYVDYSRKNAKIAGVDKFIGFSRVELEWLDIKFKKNSVDTIITNPPTTKNANIDKIYKEFFYQSEYILKDNGAIAVISRMPDFVKKYAETHNFIVSKEKDVWSGEQLLKIIVFKKKSI